MTSPHGEMEVGDAGEGHDGPLHGLELPEGAATAGTVGLDAAKPFGP